MTTKTQHVIADSGAFIRNAPFQEIGDHIYTIPEVVSELRDSKTRQRLKSPLFELTYKQPSPAALDAVKSFARQTGDYGFLSVTDLKVLALTYDLEKQYNGVEHLKKEPTRKPQFTQGSGDQSISPAASTKRYGEGEALPSHLIEGNEDEEGEESEEEVENCQDQTPVEEKGSEIDMNDEGIEEDDEDEEEEDEGEEEDDEDEGWITPANIMEVKRSYGYETVKADSGRTSVGCITTDFAMQNVLIQMGLNVLSVDGMLVRNVKTFVLRCYGCFRITKDTSRQFCPHCGNNTLRRLTTSIDEAGAVRYHLARRYTIKTRGKKFSLPKPQGGKHALNPILVADQPLPHQRASKKAVQKMDVLSADFTADSSPFKLNDVTSRAAQLGRNAKQAAPQWAKRNPNENRRKSNKSRRK